MKKHYRIIVDGIVYETGIFALKLTRPLFDKFGVGNVCSAKLELTYQPTSSPPTAARVEVEQRNDGETLWKPLGVFFIDERGLPYNGRLSLVCYDSMMLIDCPYDHEGDPGQWPRLMTDMVDWIAAQMGVEVDPRTVVLPYSMDFVTGLTVRQYLSYIGAACGGNWCITAENKLLLVPAFVITLPEGVDYLVDENGEAILTDGGMIFL